MLDLFRPQQTQPKSDQQRTSVPRCSQRHSVPMLDIPIRVHVLIAGVRHTAQLWDVSERGACLLLRSPVLVGQSVLMRIHAPSSAENIDLKAQLVWLDEVMDTYYVGVQFAEPVDFSSTFLAPLFHNSDSLHQPARRIA